MVSDKRKRKICSIIIPILMHKKYRKLGKNYILSTLTIRKRKKYYQKGLRKSVDMVWIW